MALTEQDRVTIWAENMRQGMCPGAITKPDLRAAVNAADDWIDSSAANFNAALPQPFRGAATTDQKYLLLMCVLERRMGR